MNPDKVLKEIEAATDEGFLPIIGPVKGKALIQTVEKEKPERILEVGTLFGYSAIMMASALPYEKAPEIVTIEIDKDNARVARQNIKQAGFEDKIKVKVGDAKKVIPKLKGKFDMLFLDAIKEDYLTYLKKAESKLSEDAVVVADNVKVFKHALEEYLDYVRDSGKYKSKTYDFDFDAVEVSKRTDGKK